MDPLETPQKTTRSKAHLASSLAFRLICALACHGLALEAQASIPRTTIQYDFSIARWDFSKGFHVTAIQPIVPTFVVTSADVARFIPVNDLSPTSDSGRVAAQILDRSISSFFASDLVRKSDFGRTAKTVERSMESDVSFGGTTPDSTKHNLKFAMKPVQARAQIQYTGITAAQVSYQVAEEQLDIEVRENVAAISSQVILNHRKTRNDNRDTISLRWTW